jgi:hypothetical protein
MAATQIYADLTNRIFVASSRGGAPKAFANPFHQDKLYLSIQPLASDPSGAQSSTPFQVLDGAGYSLTVLIVKRSDGSTLAGPVTSWTPDGTAKAGSIDLNTVAMASAFSGSTASVSAWVQMLFDDGANQKVTLQSDLTINRTYITAGIPSELPTTSYLTREECLALFVKFAGNPNGSTITLPSPAGTYSVVLVANDDGSGGANIEQ